MTNIIDKNLARYRPRPTDDRPPAPGWLGPIAFIGFAGLVYAFLSLAFAISLMWGR